MFIKTLNSEIEIKEFTRSVSRQMQEKLMEGVVVKGDQAIGSNPDIPAINALRAEELAISLLTGLSQEVLDSLTDKEYAELKTAVEVKKNEQPSA